MPGALKAVVERVDALSLRERAMVLAAVLAVMFMGADAWLLQPQSLQHDKLKKELERTSAETRALESAIHGLSGQQRHDPNAELQRQIEALKAEVARQDAQIGEKASGVVPPAEMPRLLEQALGGAEGLKLVSLKAQPASPLASAVKGAPAGAAGLYVHPVELVLEGGYLAALRYLEKLEAMPAGFYWDALQVQTLEYPQARISVRLHTLSQQAAWIGT
jgi:MSHA biogenesis protein MshJ